MFKVQKQRCDQCLFGKDKIVSDKRRKQILNECKQDDNHFVCHKASMKDQEVCCAGFHEAFPQVGNLHRIAQRLGAVELVTVE